jgi:flagellar FliL protein
VSASAAVDAPKPKGKKPLILGILAVLLVAAVAAWMLLGRGHVEDEEAQAGPPVTQPRKSRDVAPPTYLPMENMVVNLADTGGDRFVQLGVTLEVMDQKTADQVKAHLPAIRSATLMLVSQRTADELLTREGKQKLANDILREASHPLGFEVEGDASAGEGARRRPGPATFNPIYGVLFSSFIIQ